VHKIILIICLLSTIPAHGQGLFETSIKDESPAAESVLNGFVRSGIYIGNSVDKDIPYLQSLYGQIGLICDTKVGKSGAAYAELRFRYGDEFSKEVSEIDLREAYIDLYAGPASFRVGKQIVSWGSSSFLNPSDQFSPTNPIVRSPDPDDMKIGSWSINTKLSIAGNSSLQILWIPVYEPSVLLTEPFSFPDYITFSDPMWPAHEIRNSSYGFLYDLRSSLLDGSISFYNGYRNNPGFSLESASFNMTSFAPDEIKLYQEPFRVNSAGLNLSIPVSSYIFRTELSWMDPVDEAEDNTYLPFSELCYIGEIEQSGANVTLIAGYYGKYILSFEEPIAEPTGLTGSFPDPSTLFPPGVPINEETINTAIASQIGAFNLLYDYQLHEYYHNVYASVSIQLLNDVLKLEVPGMYNFTTKELMLRPSIEYSVTDGLLINAGISFMKGEENSLYDLVGPVINAGYLTFKVLF